MLNCFTIQQEQRCLNTGHETLIQGDFLVHYITQQLIIGIKIHSGVLKIDTRIL